MAQKKSAADEEAPRRRADGGGGGGGTLSGDFYFECDRVNHTREGKHPSAQGPKCVRNRHSVGPGFASPRRSPLLPRSTMLALSALCTVALAVLLGAQGHGALAAGVAAEGPPVLGPLIGPAQEREALARRQQQHHLRHQHHYYGDPRLTGRHPALGVSADGGAAPPAPLAPERRGAPAAGPAGPAGAGGCHLNVEHLASAVTKQLEGICNEKEIMDRFHNLGSQLADQFNVLKTMILNLEDKVGAMDIGMERAERRLLSAVSKARCGRSGSWAAEEDLGGAAEPDQEEAAMPGSASTSAALQDEDDDDEGEADYGDNPALVSVPRDGAQGPSAREEEVQRFNGTVHTEHAPQDAAGAAAGLGNSLAGCGHGHRVFTYYWRVRNMDYKMTGWNHRRSLRSPSFYVWPGG
ncbi:Protein KRBA1 [Frankliniella fusca]|uniref:Protein KRBA1 n=1 Tax=Frankliniella fusca TaxID=407009 RepID=A0AAE1HE14_9NEOP|nr:Protein KRBA1 [Frankliniella fusca]